MPRTRKAHIPNVSVICRSFKTVSGRMVQIGQTSISCKTTLWEDVE